MGQCQHFWSANDGTQECLHCRATRTAPTAPAGAAELLFVAQGREKVLTGYEPAGETKVFAVPRAKYEIVARVGKDWSRVTEAPDLRDVLAVTEYEITHGADSVNIQVKR